MGIALSFHNRCYYHCVSILYSNQFFFVVHTQYDYIIHVFTISEEEDDAINAKNKSPSNTLLGSLQLTQSQISDSSSSSSNRRTISSNENTLAIVCYLCLTCSICRIHIYMVVSNHSQYIYIFHRTKYTLTLRRRVF